MGPERKRLEFSVGIFLIIGVACLGYLALTLGNLGFGGNNYSVLASFSTVSGLKARSQVMMAGVVIGEVQRIQLKDAHAEITMGINKNVKIEEDSIATIKTMGIIGDKYVSITPGASDTYIQNGGKIRETQPPLDIESLISKFIFGNVETKKPNE
jgi:phospholipid/cholesterol/gamma-HCH transport system substrate-binding protein